MSDTTTTERPVSVQRDMEAMIAAHEAIEQSKRRRDRFVRRLRDQGVPVTEIAAALGVTRRAVYFLLDD